MNKRKQYAVSHGCVEKYVIDLTRTTELQISTNQTVQCCIVICKMFCVGLNPEKSYISVVSLPVLPHLCNKRFVTLWNCVRPLTHKGPM